MKCSQYRSCLQTSLAIESHHRLNLNCTLFPFCINITILDWVIIGFHFFLLEVYKRTTLKWIVQELRDSDSHLEFLPLSNNCLLSKLLACCPVVYPGLVQIHSFAFSFLVFLVDMLELYWFIESVDRCNKLKQVQVLQLNIKKSYNVVFFLYLAVNGHYLSGKICQICMKFLFSLLYNA